MPESRADTIARLERELLDDCRTAYRQCPPGSLREAARRAHVDATHASYYLRQGKRLSSESAERLLGALRKLAQPNT